MSGGQYRMPISDLLGGIRDWERSLSKLLEDRERLIENLDHSFVRYIDLTTRCSRYAPAEQYRMLVEAYQVVERWFLWEYGIDGFFSEYPQSEAFPNYGFAPVLRDSLYGMLRQLSFRKKLVIALRKLTKKGVACSHELSTAQFGAVSCDICGKTIK